MLALGALLAAGAAMAQSPPESALQQAPAVDLNPVLAPADLRDLPEIAMTMATNVVPMLVWKKQGGILAANQAYLDLIGYTAEELRSGQIGFATITPAHYLPVDGHCLDELRTADTCTPFVKEYRTKSGELVTVKLWNFELADGERAVGLIVPLATRHAPARLV